MTRRRRDVTQPWAVACQELADERERARLERQGRLLRAMPAESTINLEQHAENIARSIDERAYGQETPL